MGKNCTDFILSFFYFLRRRWYFRSLEVLAAVERLDAERGFGRAPHERTLAKAAQQKRSAMMLSFHACFDTGAKSACKFSFVAMI